MSEAEKIEVGINSEIGEIEAIIMHTPGPEVENMTPSTAERALYSDILNLSVASKEYSQLKGILQNYAAIFEVKDLLYDILKNEKYKTDLLKKITKTCAVSDLYKKLFEIPEKILISQLIEGVHLEKINLTNYLNKGNYSLEPLHNFFFARDSAFVINSSVFIAKMAKKVRIREALIMEAIFNYHPQFRINAFYPDFADIDDKAITIEGGDIMVYNKNILLIGIGPRTTSQGVDYIINQLLEREEIKYIIVQELPHSPESFIHLDMVLTFLDKNTCLIYEPVIYNRLNFQTVLITLEKGNIKNIETIDDVMVAFKRLGLDIRPVPCGGSKEIIIQEREQWHSGANFFTLAPGKIVGYERNIHTNEALNKHGYEIIKATDVLNGIRDLKNYKKFVVTIEGGELARGGGGPRCMTLPVKRKN
jgi:arginine deiminase